MSALVPSRGLGLRDWRCTAMAVVILALLATGVTTAASRFDGARRRATPPSPSLASSPEPAALAGPLAGTPVRIRIPAIAVDAAMGPLGLNTDGTLEVPPYDRAGWYRGRVKPGEVGPAVVAAHLDSKTGPAVFFRLKELADGDTVSVDYDDGTTVDFVVDRSASYAKDDFPTGAVYGPTGGRQLRLLTCGGSFDRRAGSYRDNLIVWATAAARHRPSPSAQPVG